MGKEILSCEALSPTQLRHPMGDDKMESPESIGGQSFFHRISRPDERTAAVITTNLAFAEWATIFGDAKVFRSQGRVNLIGCRSRITAPSQRMVPGPPLGTQRKGAHTLRSRSLSGTPWKRTMP